MQKFVVQDNIIITNLDNIHSFEYKIRAVMGIYGTLVVILDIPKGVIFYNNVYCIRDTNVIWQMQDPLKLYKHNSYLPVLYFRIDENNQINVWDFNGIGYILNAHNGIIVGQYSTR
jgi:hypothetical protein